MNRISKNHWKELQKLNQKKYRIQNGLVVIDGLRIIEQLIANKISIEEIISTNEQLALKSFPARQHWLVEDWQMEKLAGTKHPQEIAAVLKIKFPEIKKDDFLLYLDDIQDPGNLGTIFRTALAAGIDGIVLSPGCCELSNPKVIRSSLGAVFTLPSAVENWEWLKQQQAQKIAAAIEDAENIYDFKLPPEKKILVLGSEAQGISRQILSFCDHRIKIPSSSKIESLNVAVAAGICIYHFCHAR